MQNQIFAKQTITPGTASSIQIKAQNIPLNKILLVITQGAGSDPLTIDDLANFTLNGKFQNSEVTKNFVENVNVRDFVHLTNTKYGTAYVAGASGWFSACIDLADGKIDLGTTNLILDMAWTAITVDTTVSVEAYAVLDLDADRGSWYKYSERVVGTDGIPVANALEIYKVAAAVTDNTSFIIDDNGSQLAAYAVCGFVTAQHDSQIESASVPFCRVFKDKDQRNGRDFVVRPSASCTLLSIHRLV